MERRDTEVVRDDDSGTMREESHVTRDAGAGGMMDSAEVVSSATPTRRATEGISLLVWIINGLLLIRVVLKLIWANPLAGFSRFVFGLSHLFPAPLLHLLP